MEAHRKSPQNKSSKKHDSVKKFLVIAPPPPQWYDPNSRTLIPKTLRDAVDLLKTSKLAGVTINSAYASDDPYILSFIKAVKDESEPFALTKLAGLLRNYPGMLEHPYIWRLFCHLAEFWSPHKELTNYAEAWLSELIKAWTEGMTKGTSTVVINKPGKIGAGRRPTLFPKLFDQAGWLPSADADNEMRDAFQFLRFYYDLDRALEKLGDWKSLSTEFQDGPQHVVAQRTHDVRLVFKECCVRNRLKQPALSELDYQKMVQEGFNESFKGQGIRNWITCQLVATLNFWLTDGTTMELTPSRVRKTVETLKKHLGDDCIERIKWSVGYPRNEPNDTLSRFVICRGETPSSSVNRITPTKRSRSSKAKGSAT